ncbi:MAG: hypothetical protein WCJ85_04935 [Chitinophagaceae bacterium]
MKNLFIPLFLLLSLFFISCSNGALQYNNKLVDIQKQVEPRFTAFGNKMEAIGDSSNFKDLEKEASSLIVFIDEKTNQMMELKTPKGGEEFRNSLIDQFKFVKNIAKKCIILGNDTTSVETKMAIGLEFMNSEKEATELEDKTFKAQQSFAEKNGFKIQQ